MICDNIQINSEINTYILTEKYYILMNYMFLAILVE